MQKIATQIATWLAVVFGAISAYFAAWPRTPQPSSVPQSEAILMTTWLWPSLFIASLLLAAGLHFGAALISRGRRKSDANPDKALGDDQRVYMTVGERQTLWDERKAANEKYVEIKNAHEPCERTISSLQSQVRRLQERDQTWGVQIGARDRQIEQLQASIASLKWLHDIAIDQAQTIFRFVSITDWKIGKHELSRDDSYIEFPVTIWNHSIYEIALPEISGSISFNGRELTGSLRWMERIRVLTWGNIGTFNFRQSLTRDDVIHILNGCANFDFDRLEIAIEGSGEAASKVTAQLLNFGRVPPNNDALIRAYPKLQIEIKDATLNYIFDIGKYGIDQMLYLTVRADVRNVGRRINIEIETFKLIADIGGRTQVLFAENGERVWSTVIMDENKGLAREGRPFDNLNAAPLLIIPYGKEIKGRALQFMFDPVDWNAFEQAVDAPAIPFTLVLIDKSREEHPIQGAMRFKEHPKLEEL